MPVYLDTHDATELPTEMRSAVESRIKSGEKDAFGVVDRGVLLDKDAGKMHCVLEAPDMESIVRHHENLDVPLDKTTIHQADVILR